MRALKKRTNLNRELLAAGRLIALVEALTARQRR